MVSWTEADLHAYDAKARRVSSGPKSQQAVCHESLGSSPGKVENTGRVTVRIVSFRRRLLDIDNLAGGTKAFIDSLRYAKLIQDDNPQAIILEVSQVKVGKKAEEHTEIELIYSDDPPLTTFSSSA